MPASFPERRLRRPAPPAWLWGVALSLVLVWLAASVPSFIEHRPNFAFWKYNRQRIVDWAEAADAGGLRIALFADSRLGRATFWDDEMEAFAEETAGLSLDVLRISRGGGRVAEFAPLFDELLAARPQWVLFQLQTLMNASADESLHALYLQPEDAPPLGGWRHAFAGDGPYQHQAFVFRSIVEWPRSEVSPAAFQVMAQNLFRCRPERTKRNLRSHSRQDPAKFVQVPPLVEATFELFLSRAAGQGVRVAFVEVPMHDSIETLPAPRARRAVAKARAERWVAEGRAELWMFPKTLGEADYCERVHMSQSGRRQYSTWLVDRLASVAP